MNDPLECASCRAVHGTYVCRSKVNPVATMAVQRGTLGTSMRHAAELVTVAPDGMCTVCRMLPEQRVRIVKREDVQ